MKRKRSCNENLRASAFDAKQMQLTVPFFFFFLRVSLTAGYRSCLIFNMADITHQRFSLAAYHCYPNTTMHKFSFSTQPKVFLLFPLTARFIKINNLAEPQSFHDSFPLQQKRERREEKSGNPMYHMFDFWVEPKPWMSVKLPCNCSTYHFMLSTPLT